MAWIRSSPFGKDEDAADFMIGIVAREPEAEGKPLTKEERDLLRREMGRKEPPSEFEPRLRRLVERILEREKETGVSQEPRSFSGAIEWAGDMEYPLVVQLAEGVVCGNPQLQMPLKGWARVKDALLCIGCGTLVVLFMFLVVGILGFLGLLK